MELERYWIFATCCTIVVAFLVRLLLRERVALQHSLAFLLFMVGLLTAAVFPALPFSLGRLMGFSLPSNFFFAILIGVLVLLHIGTVVALSRLESRTIALTQEFGLMQEQLNRMAPAERRPTEPTKQSAAPAQPHPTPPLAHAPEMKP